MWHGAALQQYPCGDVQSRGWTGGISPSAAIPEARIVEVIGESHESRDAFLLVQSSPFHARS